MLRHNSKKLRSPYGVKLLLLFVSMWSILPGLVCLDAILYICIAYKIVPNIIAPNNCTKKIAAELLPSFKLKIL